MTAPTRSSSTCTTSGPCPEARRMRENMKESVPGSGATLPTALPDRQSGHMRPTVPLAAWRIAVDLEATRNVQNQPGLPAVGCPCECCANWSRVWPSVFPDGLRQQLERLQIDLAHPSDLYERWPEGGGSRCRVIYHVVGKLLSGPAAFRTLPTGAGALVYQRVVGATDTLELVVVRSAQTHDAHPVVDGIPVSDLLQVELQVHVPHGNTPQRDH